MKLSFGLVMLFTLALVFLFASGQMTPSVAGAAPTIRWDTISLSFPNGVGTVDAGGSDYALADDLTTIQISGHGTFSSPGAPVSGGGTWATSGPSGTASGTFRVTGLVRWDVAPGSLPPGFVDNIGPTGTSRSGLAILRVNYQDESGGTLVVSCHQPVGSPSGIFEGITATKGFVGFHERVPPVGGVNANRTLFHVVP
ncbi:MAG: hypothetical protein DMG86_15425 [Acidobacteria bacterium]|nr:MAG: hypothetical protein DMG86_15425 [Acidobacteriota bacterium]